MPEILDVIRTPPTFFGHQINWYIGLFGASSVAGVATHSLPIAGGAFVNGLVLSACADLVVNLLARFR